MDYRRRENMEEMAEIQDVVEEYRRNTSNYGRKFHKTRPPGSFESSKDRVNSWHLEEYADEARI